MKRRNVLAALGVAGSGAAFVTGSGAFTSVEAQRDATVEVADDANAYLSITDTGNANAEYVTEDNGSSNSEFGLDFTSSNSPGGGGVGVNANAVTVFEDLFEVRNQGTQRVEVEVTPLAFVRSSGGNTTLIVLAVPESGFPSVEVDPGNAEAYDLIVTATDDATSSVNITQTITVKGEAA
jgi:hypothetical protein